MAGYLPSKYRVSDKRKAEIIWDTIQRKVIEADKRMSNHIGVNLFTIDVIIMMPKKK